VEPNKRNIRGFAVLALLLSVAIALAGYAYSVNADGVASHQPSSSVSLCFQYLPGGEVSVDIKWGPLRNSSKIKVAPGSSVCAVLRGPYANIRKSISVTLKTVKGDTLLTLQATPSVMGYVLTRFEVYSNSVFLPRDFLSIKELVAYVVPTVSVKVNGNVSVNESDVDVLVNGIKASNINVSKAGNQTYVIALHDKLIVDPAATVKVALHIKKVGDVTAFIRLVGDLSPQTVPRIQAVLVANGSRLVSAKVSIKHYVAVQEFHVKAPVTIFGGGTIRNIATYVVYAEALPGAGTYTINSSETTSKPVSPTTTSTATKPTVLLPLLNPGSDVTNALIRALIPSAILLLAGVLMRSKKMVMLAIVLGGVAVALQFLNW